MERWKIETKRGWCMVSKPDSPWPMHHEIKRYCPLCGENVFGETVYMLINNYEMFPNILVHQACAPEMTEEVINQIHNNYLEYKAFEKKYRAWIHKWR